MEQLQACTLNPPIRRQTNQHPPTPTTACRLKRSLCPAQLHPACPPGLTSTSVLPASSNSIIRYVLMPLLLSRELSVPTSSLRSGRARVGYEGAWAD